MIVFLQPERARDNTSATRRGEFLEARDGSEVDLLVPTEVSPVPPESRVMVYTVPRSCGADRFRFVQIRLKSLQASKRLKSLLITSPLPGDGKTTAALNLATALSEKGRRPVLLLEADVIRPTILKMLNLNPWDGLAECFKSKNDPMLAIRRIEPLGFYLLPAGKPDAESHTLLQSGFISQLIGRLSASAFAWIVIDSLPNIPIAESLALRAQTDATLLIARARKTPREAIEEAAQRLGRDHIIGIMLNDMQRADCVYSKYYGYRA